MALLSIGDLPGENINKLLANQAAGSNEPGIYPR